MFVYIIRDFIEESKNKMRVRGKLAKLPTLFLYITVGDTGKDTKRISCHIFPILRLYFSKYLLNLSGLVCLQEFSAAAAVIFF